MINVYTLNILIKGYIMVEHVKSVDYQARCVEYIERTSEELICEVLAKLYPCLY